MRISPAGLPRLRSPRAVLPIIPKVFVEKDKKSTVLFRNFSLWHENRIQ